MNKVTRGERLMEKLVASGSLTPAGKDWLIAALDPMHDTQLKELQGWPDICDQPSVIRCVKKTHTITAPTYSGDGTWNLVIMTNPTLNRTNPHLTDVWGNYALGAVEGVDAQDAGFVTWGKFQGVNAGDFSLTGKHWAETFGQMSVPNEFCAGNGRLVGAGIEANDVTADLYKQGTLHCFRQAQSNENDSQTWNHSNSKGVMAPGGGATVQVAQNSVLEVQPIQWWPANEESVTLLPGTRTWKAEEGCYMVVPFQSVENPATTSEIRVPLLSDDITKVGGTPGIDPVVSQMWMPTAAYTEISGTSQYLYSANKFAPVHSAGMVFMGLNKQAAITLTLNLYYEYFPVSTEVDLATLAKPSASYDPVALSLYSEALKSLPVGVPASMNGLGDWFASVVSRFAPALGIALTPLLGPAAMGVATVAKGVADSYLTSQTPKTQPRGPPPPLPSRALQAQILPARQAALQAPPKKKKKKKKPVQNRRK
nr:putative structural protein [Stellavirales sp.]